MDKLLGIEELVEIKRLKYKLVTSCTQSKQSSQTLTTLAKGMCKSVILINQSDLKAKNLVQNVKIGYFFRSRFCSNHHKTLNEEKESVEGK